MASQITPKKMQSKYDLAKIFLFIPNMIDYFRLLFLLIGFYFWKSSPMLFLFNYFMCYLLDEFDGILARKFDQTSKFGAILDMIIDRIATVLLLGILAIFYPFYASLFLSLIMLDIGSHWMQTHSALLGTHTENHKNLQEDFWIVEIYYKSRLALCVICWFAEIFLAQLYYIHFNLEACNKLWFSILLYFSLFFYIIKQIISCLQIFSASKRIANYDIQEYIAREIIDSKIICEKK